VLPSHPLIVYSLHRPLIVSSCLLDVAPPLSAPPSCRTLIAPPSHCLALAGCCVASPRAAFSSSLCVALSSSCCPLTALPSHLLIAPAGCCILSCHIALLSSSHCAAPSLSYASRLLRRLLLLCPLVLLLYRHLVLSLSSHCITLLLSHLTSWLLCRSLTPPLSCRLVPAGCCIASCCAPSRPLSVPPSHSLDVCSMRCPLINAGWLLRCLSLHRPLIILSLRCPFVVLCKLVVVLPLIAPPSCPLVMPPYHSLIVLSLCRSLVVSSHQLVIALLSI
jgi:hypothetical protein